jgi:hypothetical protein
MSSDTDQPRPAELLSTEDMILELMQRNEVVIVSWIDRQHNSYTSFHGKCFETIGLARCTERQVRREMIRRNQR